MANNEEGVENITRGNEWEVVSLTESTYAAAPGPQEVESKNDDGSDNHGEDQSKIPNDLVNSHHFVFDHKNLLNSEERVGKDLDSELVAKEAGRSSGQDDEHLSLKELNVPDEFKGIQQFDEKGNRMSIRGEEFEEGKNLQDLNLSDKEQNMYSLPPFSTFHDEPALVGSTANGENTTVAEPSEHSEEGLDTSVDVSQSPKPAKECKCDESNLPCEAWWKSKAASMYAHAKEANTFWSIFIAAAVMGIVILGHRWQREKWQTLQLKRQLSIGNERTGGILRPISRLKGVIVGGHRRGSFIGGHVSVE